jgi:Uma2 family endonuclease
MTILEKRRSLFSEEVRQTIQSLKPGDTFAWDRPITIVEFCELLGAETSAELIHGVIYMTPPPSDPHEDLQGWLFFLIKGFVDGYKLGKVRGSRSGVRISATSLREPDILFFSNSSLDRMNVSGIHGAPDFIVEIVDSNDARRDAVTKQDQYGESGVQELWVIDLPRKELRHFVLQEGLYHQLSVDPDGEVEPQAVPGCRLKVAWLFQGPDFPESLSVLDQLLGRAPRDQA